MLAQSVATPNLSEVATAVRSLIFARLYLVAVAWVTTKAFWSAAGELVRTVMPPPFVARIACSAAALAAGSPVVLVAS